MPVIESALAFAEGVAVIASPCILPVLPLVLAASAEGGRQRPFGVIIGFILAFSLFAFAARKLLALLGIDPGVLQTTSLVLLSLFGLLLLSTRLTEAFSRRTQALAQIGIRAGGNNSQGLLGGIAIGSLIGLVWTPCAGPVLAAVLVQVIRQQTDAGSFAVIFSFAAGAGLPMLAIAWLGRGLLARAGFVSRHAEALRKAMGAVIVAAALLIASGIDLSSPLTRTAPGEPAKPATGLEKGLARPYPAPDFTGIEAWLNSPPLAIQNLKGKVVLVDFWTYSCINCVRTLPHITAWDQKYRAQGLVIVGIHAPEFEFEKKRANVEAAIAAHGIRYPVALDNALSTWDNFSNRYWPAHYLISREGLVVYTHFGEGEYAVTENNIRYLLGLKGKERAAAEKSMAAYWQTPETYLGYYRADRFEGEISPFHDTVATQSFPPALKKNHWALSGQWRIEGERIVAMEKGAALRLHFSARKVFLVLGAAGQPLRLHLTLNGKPLGPLAGKDAPDSQVTVTGHTIYELVDQKTSAGGVLEITSDAPGLEAYAFTFG